MKQFRLISMFAVLAVLGANWAALAVEVNLLPPPGSPWPDASGQLSVTYGGPYKGLDGNKYYTYYVTGSVNGLPFVENPAIYVLTGSLGSGPRSGSGGGAKAGVYPQAAVTAWIVEFSVGQDGSGHFEQWGEIRTSKFTSFEVWLWRYDGVYGNDIKVLSGNAK